MARVADRIQENHRTITLVLVTMTTITTPGSGEPIEMFSVCGSTMPAPATVWPKGVRAARPAARLRSGRLGGTT